MYLNVVLVYDCDDNDNGHCNGKTNVANADDHIEQTELDKW